MKISGLRESRCAFQRVPTSTTRSPLFPAIELIEVLVDKIAALVDTFKGPVDAIGVAVPGAVCHGVIEDSPNLPQIKGMRLGDEPTKSSVREACRLGLHRQRRGCNRCRRRSNARSAQQAHTRLDDRQRHWLRSLADVEGVWEGGHVIVTLDPKERFCGCGGVGTSKASWDIVRCACAFSTLNLNRSSRRQNKATPVAVISSIYGIARWPRVLRRSSIWPDLDASTSLAIMLGFLELPVLRSHLETMVKMSPLLSYSLEILPPDDETALIGAGVSVLRALTWEVHRGSKGKGAGFRPRLKFRKSCISASALPLVRPRNPIMPTRGDLHQRSPRQNPAPWGAMKSSMHQADRVVACAWDARHRMCKAKCRRTSFPA